MAHLALSFLGPFQATLDGQTITTFESNKVRALLAYLVVEAARLHSREALAGLLWADHPNHAAVANLRHVLSNLRAAIGDRQAAPPFLFITRETIQFNAASDCSHDLQNFDLRDLPLEPLERITAAYRGPFLEGLTCDSALFEEWVTFKREQIGRQLLAALRRLAEHAEHHGEYERAIACAHRQLELEPWDEEARQQLMRTLALSGQRSAALAQYETGRRLLRRELGIEPAPETTALYERIRDGTLGQETGQPADKEKKPPSPSFLRPEPAERPRPVFVARERELAQLDSFLNLALAGQGRVVFVTGDPGSGKTALIQEFVRRALAQRDDVIAAQGNGNAHTGIGTPYLPFSEALQMLMGDVEAQWISGAITRSQARRLWALLPTAAQGLMEAGPDLVDRFVSGATLLACIASFSQWASGERAAWPAQLAAWLQRKAAAPPDPTGPQQADLFEQYTQVLQTLARQAPLILVLDDLQWADAGSLNLLFHLGKQVAGSRILTVGAYRPGDVALGRLSASSGQWERHPLEPVVNEFQRDWGDIDIDLTHAEGRPFVEALLDTEPNCLGEPFRQTLFQHTGGHPLFTVELLRGLQERGDLQPDRIGRWVAGPSLNWDQLPARVEAVIAEQIGRLPAESRLTLAIASVEGVEFTAEAVARVQDADPRDLIRRLSGELSRQRRLVSAAGCRQIGEQRLSRYRFRHYLFQRYLYHSLDEAERVQLHKALGCALEALYGEQAPQEAVALAWHFEAAGQTSKAVDYLLQAGTQAARLAANQEAIAHLTRGLALLQTLPASPARDRRELALQLALGAPLLASRGYTAPELGRAYTRARELCQRMGEAPELFTVRMGLAAFYFVQAEYPTGLELVEQLFATAHQTGDPDQLALACWGKGYPLLCLGEFVQARPLLESAIASYDPQRHRPLLYLLGMDMGVYARSWLALVLWALGYPDQALRHGREAIALAREIPYPFVLAQALAVAGAILSDLRRDASAEQAYTEELIQLGSKAGFLQTSYGMIYLGHLRARGGQLAEGITLMRQGLETMWAVGHRSNWAHLRTKLVEGYILAGDVEAGLAAAAEALAFMQRTGEHFAESDLQRLQGELFLLRGDVGAAEASFRQAIEIARRQQARLWELRAATSLSRLWLRQGRAAEARQSLAELYAWFSEGWELPDLQEARALLE